MYRMTALLILSLALVSCTRCCRHCPNGEIQKISHIPKKEFYKNHYAPEAVGKRAMS